MEIKGDKGQMHSYKITNSCFISLFHVAKCMFHDVKYIFHNVKCMFHDVKQRNEAYSSTFQYKFKIKGSGLHSFIKRRQRELRWGKIKLGADYADKP